MSIAAILAGMRVDRQPRLDISPLALRCRRFRRRLSPMPGHSVLAPRNQRRRDDACNVERIIRN